MAVTVANFHDQLLEAGNTMAKAAQSTAKQAAGADVIAGPETAALAAMAASYAAAARDLSAAVASLPTDPPPV